MAKNKKGGNPYVNAKKENIEKLKEKLKAENQMEWVAQMNNIRDRATEIVNHDIIYT